MQEKAVSESEVIMQHAPMPDETNISGSLHGGNLLKLIDTAGGIAASRHARSRVVTASLERLDFLAPINLGELITLRACLNMTGTSSMDVRVEADTENFLTGEKRRVAECFLTYVAVDQAGKPVAVPPLRISTPEEKACHEAALERRRYRTSLKSNRK